ncbi:hypothetical protein HDU91_003403 [Kappamyces sp. JEL0680]|nr:hypothetical protein HDU91_003403 [Kappamyces sp. JEL0680]
MGKTIQTLALIHEKRLGTSTKEAGTLIVAPLALIRQWEREILSKSARRLSVYVHHGSNRASQKSVLRKYDVVITTYSVLANEMPKQAYFDSHMRKNIPEYMGGALFNARFRRIIIDEAQIVKNRRTRTSLACCTIAKQPNVQSTFCLSGTPVQNSIDDLFPLFSILGHSMGDNYAVFSEQVSSKIKKEDLKECALAIKRLQVVLRNVMMRRTKTSVNSRGDPIVKLPGRHIENVNLTLSPAERSFYNAIENKANHLFEVLLGASRSSYSSFLVLLLRLRQAASHPLLIWEIWENAKKGHYGLDFMDQNVVGRLDMAGQDAVPVRKSQLELATSLSPDLWELRTKIGSAVFSRLQQLASQNELLGQECPICCDIMSNDVVISCGHLFCRECFDGLVFENPVLNDGDVPTKTCPVCQNECPPHQVFDAAVFRQLPHAANSLDSVDAAGEEGPEMLKSILLDLCPNRRFSDSFSSSKIEKMVSILNETRSRSRTVKTVVFSQWTYLLDLAATALAREGFKSVRYDGSMSNDDREESLQVFRDSKSVTCCLVSLKAGGVGLNLVAASQVIMLDLWWNPALEEQAIDRIHRIGQLLPVTIYKLTVADSVEDRILELQEQKRQVAQGALGEGEFKVGKLSRDEITFLMRGRPTKKKS